MQDLFRTRSMQGLRRCWPIIRLASSNIYMHCGAERRGKTDQAESGRIGRERTEARRMQPVLQGYLGEREKNIPRLGSNSRKGSGLVGDDASFVPASVRPNHR